MTWKEATVPSGISPEKVYIGPDPQGQGGFQVAVATATSTPTRGKLRELFLARKGKTSIQLVVAVTYRDTVHLFGPDPGALDDPTDPSAPRAWEVRSRDPRRLMRALPAEHVHRRTRSAGVSDHQRRPAAAQSFKRLESSPKHCIPRDEDDRVT